MQPVNAIHLTAEQFEFIEKIYKELIYKKGAKHYDGFDGGLIELPNGLNIGADIDTSETLLERATKGDYLTAPTLPQYEITITLSNVSAFDDDYDDLEVYYNGTTLNGHEITLIN